MSDRQYDIAVIGGGVIGMALARRLAGEKARVAVIDAAADIPPATIAAAGMLTPSLEEAAGASEALYRFGVDSLRQWPDFAKDLEAETGADVDYRSDGVLGVAFTEIEFARLEHQAEALTRRGGSATFISGDEARALEPALSPAVIAGLLADQDAQVDPRKLLTALRAGFGKRGGELLSARVERVEEQSGGFLLRLKGGEKLSAEKIVLASGAASGSIIEGLPAAPVTPVKGEAVALKMKADTFKRVIRGPGAYLCPKAEDRLIVGATELHGRNDMTVEARAIEALKADAVKLIPAARDYPEIERWAGIRPATPDGAPILGGDTRGPDNVFLALGHYRNGILLAPASADALATEILEGKRLEALEAFRAERFEEYE